MFSSDIPEEVVKILKIGSDGFPSCHVGHIPRRLFRKFDPKSFEKNFLKVEEDYRLSDNSHERHQSHHIYHGLPRCLVIHNNCWFNSRDYFNGEGCILLEGTSSSGKKKKNEKEKSNEKEKISVTDKEKLLAKFANTSTRCKPIQFNQVLTKHRYTPLYQPRFAITVGGPQDDNSTVTDAVTVQILEEDNTTAATESLIGVNVLEKIPI
jgi:hypothetical protein